MGSLCSSCFGSNGESSNLMPSPETRRRQQLEAAERRREENEHRGIKNPESVRRQQQRAEELARREDEAARMGGGAPNLKWQSN
ncbi:small VCP/p97-interacting protein [Ceratitis capitata]|uniref:small VCP/p97-interacting protein n=1 Tax=Ceratitis capitata TaxID=7213 RepID=UPI00032A305D|nr:small VCP/p97-interacting protein [Ceratitis capitata]XP_020714639.1 small VCP/p97-interacting protein [Ceratitis capitata]